MHFIVILIVFFSISSVNAHPVAFQGSVGIMGYHSPVLTHNQVNYSLRYWVAMGLHHFRRIDTDENRHATIGTVNLLLKRWYGKAFQANIYSLLGVGSSEFYNKPESVGLGGLQFDIEDRRYYFLTKYSEILDQDKTQLKQYVVRFGLAPYVGDFEDLHTWVLLDWSDNHFFAETTQGELTPMLRFFYKNVLFELGQSFQGNSKFNFIIHY